MNVLLEQATPNLAAKAQEEYDTLFSQQPDKYRTHLSNYDLDNPEKAELEPDEDEDLYLIKDQQDNLLGYLQACQEQPGTPTPDAPVLRDYTNQGDSLTINKLEIFEKYQGIGLGGEVMEQLKGRGYELIDLTARESAERFYLRHGFKDTGLRDEGKKVLAWHNPEYESRKATLLEQQAF